MSEDIAADASLIDSAMTVWKTKVRYIGVGTIGIAAIWTLLFFVQFMYCWNGSFFPSMH